MGFTRAMMGEEFFFDWRGRVGVIWTGLWLGAVLGSVGVVRLGLGWGWCWVKSAPIAWRALRPFDDLKTLEAFILSTLINSKLFGGLRGRISWMASSLLWNPVGYLALLHFYNFLVMHASYGYGVSMQYLSSTPNTWRAKRSFGSCKICSCSNAISCFEGFFHVAKVGDMNAFCC